MITMLALASSLSIDAWEVTHEVGETFYRSWGKPSLGALKFPKDTYRLQFRVTKRAQHLAATTESHYGEVVLIGCEILTENVEYNKSKYGVDFDGVINIFNDYEEDADGLTN